MSLLGCIYVKDEIFDVDAADLILAINHALDLNQGY